MLTAENVHDSQIFEKLLSGHEKIVYADSACKSPKNDELFVLKGLINKVLKRAYSNKPLSEEWNQFNRLASGVRRTVERVFGTLKLHYGMSKARYLGLTRNRIRFGLLSLTHNVKRSARMNNSLIQTVG